MKLGYCSSGLAHHDPIQAIELLADIGYESIALTVDHGWLAPDAMNRLSQLEEVSQLLDELGFCNVIDAGANYLLDPVKRQWPSLIVDSKELAQQRIDHLKYCIDLAAQLDSDCVTICSGECPIQMDDQAALDCLAANLEVVVRYADDANVDIGFEPEPGMFIETTSGLYRLMNWFDSPRLNVTLNIGHLYCLGELPIVDVIHRWSERLVTVNIEDMVAGAHDHLMFGTGEIYFPPIIECLLEIGYQGGLHVDLESHSPVAAEASMRSYEFLEPLIRDAQVRQQKS